MEELMKDQIIAMAVAAIAQETGKDIKNLRVVNFREVGMSPLRKYLNDNKIKYKKYTLEDEVI